MESFFPRVGRFTKLAICLLIVLNCTICLAQDPFVELRIRIERVEQENRELKTTVPSKILPASFESAIPPSPITEHDFPDPNEPLTGASEETDEEKHFNSRIEKYLRRRPRETEPGVAVANSNVNALDSKVGELFDRLNKRTFPTVRVNVAFQADTGFFSQDANSRKSYGDLANGADLRRTRLQASGSINESVNYFIQMDFAFLAPPGQTASFRTIPELFIGQSANVVNGGSSFQPVPGGANGTPFFVNTRAKTINYYNVLGTELLLARGPLSVQSEGMVNFVDQAGTTATLPGVYAQVGYFLTGEHRPYDRKLGAIDRIMPFKNFSFSKDGFNIGMGAWEVAGRFSYIDLNDKSIQGGTMTNYTAGL